MNHRILAVIGALLCASLLETARGQTLALRYGQIPSSVRSVGSLPFFIAQRKGFFSREGVDVALVPIAGGADKMIAALDEGTVDITRTATPYLIQAVIAGSDAVAIAGEIANPIYSLIVKPEIESFADLRGRLLGLSIAVDTISISMRKLLALNGLREPDFRVKELVGTPARFDCLKHGECDGVPLAQPEDLVAVGQGYRRLGISSEAVPEFQFTVTAVRRAWGQANQDTLVRYVRALAAAFRFIRDPQNREEVVRAIEESTGSSEEIARLILALYFEPERGVLPRQAELDLKGLARVIEFMGETGAVKPPLPSPETFVDLQYLRMTGIQ